MPLPPQAICVRSSVEGPHPHASLTSLIATKSSATPNVRSPRQAETSPSAFHYVGSSGRPSLTAQRVGIGGEGNVGGDPTTVMASTFNFASNHSSILTLHNTTARDATPTHNNNAYYSTTVRDGGASPASSLRLGAAGGTLVSLGESDGTNGGGVGGVGRAATLKSFSSVAEVRSRQHMSGSKHTSLIHEEKSSHVHTAEVSRRREKFELLTISHPKEVAEEKVAATITKRRQLCTVPLLSVYVFQCIIVIAAFCSIIAYAHVRIDATATSLIENSIQVALKNAALEVYGPLQTLEEQLLEYRSRYYADGVVNKWAYSPCNDYNLSSLPQNATGDVLSLQDSVAFYSDQLLTMGTFERIVASFVATQISTTDVIDWSNKSSYADIQSLISHCSVSTTSLFRRYGNLSKMTLRVPNISEIGDLDSLPISHGPNPNGYGTHEDKHILMILRSTALTNTPFIHPGQGLFMLFTTPTHYVVINSTNGQRSTYAEETTPVSNFLGRSDVLRISVLSGMGIAASMTDYVEILLAITPDGAGAFTSLYDLTNNIVLASTRYAPDEQYDKASGTLYAAGRASSVLLNRYFYESKVMDLPPDTSHVDFDGSDGRVIAAIRFDMPVSGTVYGIVQTIPREHYYGPINRLRSVMIALGVICCLLVVATCVCIAVGIFRGIEQLLANMALAAAMKNDQTTYIRTFITDVDRLAKGFGSMNDRLLVARAYLPQHLLLSSSSDESGAEEEEGDYDEGAGDAQRSNTARGTRQSKGDTEGGSRSRRTTSLASQTSTINNNTNNNSNKISSSDAPTTKDKRRNVLRDKADAPKKGGTAANSGGAGAGASHGVTVKRVTILTINARGFHKFIDVKQPFTVVAGVADITEVITQTAQTHKGVIDSFHGDHFVISFNAARSCSEGPAKAAACALAFADAARNRRQYVAMGLSCGRACVGHLGTSSMKRLSIVGSVYSRAMALGRVCYRFNPPLPTGSDAKTVLDVKRSGKAKGSAAAYEDEEDEGDSEEDDDNDDGRDGKAGEVGDAAEDIRRLMSIQLIADESVVSDVQHSFELQLLGGLYGSPYSCAPLLEDDIPAPRPHHTTVRSEGRPLDPAGGDEDMVSSFGSEQQQSDANRAGQILGAGLGGGAQNDQGANGLALVYAVRGHSNTREDSEADEWLYELAASKSSLLADINSAFETYIASLPSARIPPPLAPTPYNLHHHHTLSSQSNNGNLIAETKVVVSRTPGGDPTNIGPINGLNGMAAAAEHTRGITNYRRYAQCVFDLSAKLASVRNRLHPTTDGLSSNSGVEGGFSSERDELVLSALRYAEGIAHSSAHSPHRRGRKLSSSHNTCCCGHCGEESSRLRGNRMSSLEPAYTAAGCFFTGVNRVYK